MKRRNPAAAAAALCLIFGQPAFAANGETVLHTFTGLADGGASYSGVTMDRHGNIFGTTSVGGLTGCYTNGCGTVFELIRDGKRWTFATIYTFQGSDGANPWAAPIADAHGNLFGTTQYGGDSACGVAYELSPTGGGQWSQKVLHSFHSSRGNRDGCMPHATLTFGPDGNLYGTTTAGGGGNTVFGPICSYGCGTVFELSHKRDGSWKERVLHAFPPQTGTTDGLLPYYGVVFDSKGNLWGMTARGGTPQCGGGGTPGCGIVYKLSPAGDGAWNETIGFVFLNSKTGTNPFGGLAIDGADNLYGPVAGSPGLGAIFQMRPQADGSLSESLIHVFRGCGHECHDDGAFPNGSFVFDAEGSLYGTTYDGGGAGTICKPIGCGTLFKLTPDGQGGWNETLLHRFTGEADGYQPNPDRLAVDSKGHVFGTTPGGGSACPQYQVGCGVVFKIKR